MRKTRKRPYGSGRIPRPHPEAAPRERSPRRACPETAEGMVQLARPLAHSGTSFETRRLRLRSSGRGSGRHPSRPISFIGVEPEAAPFGFVLLRARVVGRHRCGIDDDARSRRGNDIWRLRRLRAWLWPDRLGRRRDAGAGTGAAIASAGGGVAGATDAPPSAPRGARQACARRSRRAFPTARPAPNGR